MGTIEHRFVQTNGIRMHVAEHGSGPLVILCHGFPESWYSWRHQLQALADAGYRVVAPDMRGYGQTDAPADVAEYSMLHLVGDIVGLVAEQGASQAVVVGHDWGAPVAWHCALLRPDLFRGVAALSVPYRGRGSVPPTSVMPRDERMVFYQLYFQHPGVAEAELAADVRFTMRALLYGGSGDAPQPADLLMVPRDGGFLTRAAPGARLPDWLREEDLDFYAAEFARAGFRGGLNWYRNIDRNWALLAPFSGAKVTVPALFIGGERDPVLASPAARHVVAHLAESAPRLHRCVMLPGCGHWTQQERAHEVNAALLDFLGAVHRP
jgi:pimeloyl-ACP methyl ester carboxylesterase